MKARGKLAAVAISVVLLFGTFALAQDSDDYYYRGGNVAQTRQNGYDSGFHDGQRKGQHEGRENDPYDYHTPDWHQATHGYKSWMGPVNVFQNGYQQGYAEGFRAGFESERPNRRGDRDDRYRGNGFYGGSGYRDRGAYDTGYRDGTEMAREDMYKNKRFNSEPRARFGGRDDGYSREYGDKNLYKSEYSDGYHAGYESAFNRRY